MNEGMQENARGMNQISNEHAIQVHLSINSSIPLIFPPSQYCRNYFLSVYIKFIP